MTPICTINGMLVSEATIDIPRIGVWHADLLVDSFDSVNGKAVIQYSSQTFNGVFARNGPDINKKLRARVLGGAGSLSKVLPPRGYRGVPLRIPLVDAVNGAGEVLSPTADSGLLGTQLSAWSRIQMTAGQAIDALLQVVTPNLPSWRVLIDGTIWAGFESWPSKNLPNVVLLYSEPERGNITVHSIDPVILPGMTFSYLVPGKATISRKISYVRHVLRPRFMHTTLYYE